MRVSLKALFFSLPIWFLLSLEAFLVTVSFGWLSWIDSPGVFLIILIFRNKEWFAIHNIPSWIFLIVNCAFYYILLYFIFILWSRANTKRI